MARKNNYVWVFMGAVVIYALLARYPTYFGLPVAIGNTLSQLWGIIFITCIGVYMMFNAKQEGKFFGPIFAGIDLVMLFQRANTAGIVTATFFGSLSLQQAQIWIMIASVILGAAWYSH